MDDAVRNEILKIFGMNNFATKIVSKGCRASLRGVHDRLIVNVDRYTRSLTCRSKRCDYILFFQHASNNKLICVLIELKSGEYDVGEIVEKLQRTASYLDKSLNLEKNLNVELILCPLLLRKRGPHSTERRKFERASIRYRGKKSLIYKGKCGSSGNVIEAMQHLFNVKEC